MTTRTELIADLRLNHEYCPKEVILLAADMLEADGAEFRPDWVSYKQGKEDGKAELDQLREAARLALNALIAMQSYAAIDKAIAALQEALK